MAEEFVMPVEVHDALVTALFVKRGYAEDEAQLMARFCASATTHGVRTHNAIKAAHLDELFGRAGGCVPRAEIENLPSKFLAVERWNANKKMGQAVAYKAMDRAMELASKYGTGTVAVDNAFHYLWGAGYTLYAADKGFIAYTCCTSSLAEVVPFCGKHPTLGTNPHSWAFPTAKAGLPFNISIDWATSTVAMGRVQQLKMEGQQLPPGAAVDKDGKETRDPNQVAALLPFGAHKGYGLSLIDELYAAYGGGSLPTIRNKWSDDSIHADEKRTTFFLFHVIHPEAISAGSYGMGRDQDQNVKAVVDDILGHGNENCMLPGQPEGMAAAKTKKAGGLVFTKAELTELKKLADECGHAVDFDALPKLA